MFNVVKDFTYNGVEYHQGEQVDPALLEVDDKAALLHGGFLSDPAAPKKDAKEVIVNRDILSPEAAAQIEADGVVKLTPKKKAGRK